MLRLASFLIVLPAAAALAHPGHLETLAGHDHWVAGAVIGLAIALGIWGALKGKKDPEVAPEEESEDTPDEAPA